MFGRFFMKRTRFDLLRTGRTFFFRLIRSFDWFQQRVAPFNWFQQRDASFFHDLDLEVVGMIGNFLNWKCFVKNDRVRSRMIEFQSFLLSRVDVDPIHRILMKVDYEYCKYTRMVTCSSSVLSYCTHCWVVLRVDFVLHVVVVIVHSIIRSNFLEEACLRRNQSRENSKILAFHGKCKRTLSNHSIHDPIARRASGKDFAR